MSSWDLSEQDEPPVRRVREDARDSVAVVVCTLAASIAVTLAVTLLTKLAG